MKKLLLFIFLSNFLVHTYGQDNPFDEVSIASPTAAALGKYGDIPVNYHTGIPSISIPIYTVKEGSLQLPISLSYHASGLKTMEVASWVGAGWSLEAGGVITRTVNGAPDEKFTSNVSNQGYGHYSDKGYSNYALSENLDWDDFAEGRKDGEPDMFSFNVNGITGKFYFRDDQTPVLVPEQDVKIEPNYTGSGSIQSFILTSSDGTKYYFGIANEAGDVVPIEKTNPFTAASGFIQSNVISSWYLNKIESHDGIFKINLTYEAENYGVYNISMFPIISTSALDEYKLVKNLIDGVRLSKISFSNGTVDFIEGASREDVNGTQQSFSDDANTSAKRLDKIEIKDASSFCKKYDFEYDYFIDNSTSLKGSFSSLSITTDKKRLKLLSLQELSCDGSLSIPEHTFEYYTELVPRRLSFAQDHWGFINGNTNNTRLIPTYFREDTKEYISGADRDSYWPAMRGGTLQKITYPTGGSVEYEFEPNETYVSYQEWEEDAVLSMSAGYDGSNSWVSQTNTISGNPHQVYFSNSGSAGLGIFEIRNSAGVLYEGESASPGTSYEYLYNLQSGINTFKLRQDNTTTGDGASLTVTKWQQNNISGISMVGGLRIKAVTAFDGYSTSNNIVTNYEYTYASNGQPSGILYGRPAYVQIVRNDVLAEAGYQSGSHNPDGCLALGSNMPFYKSPSSYRPMESSQGNHIGYNEVRVYKTGNGYSIYRYYGSDLWDAIIDDVAYRSINPSVGCDTDIPNHPAAPIPFEPKRGKLKYEGHFSDDVSIGLTNEKTYYYTYDEEEKGVPGFIVTHIDNKDLATYYELKSHKLISSQITESQKENGNWITTNSFSYYESDYHAGLTRSRTELSANELLESKNKLAFDFRIPNCEAISFTCDNDLTSDISGCEATYTAEISNPNISKWQAWQNYSLCQRNARSDYVTCRELYSSSFQSCFSNTLASANDDLKAILTLRQQYRNPSLETSQWKDNELIAASYTSYDFVTIPGDQDVQPSSIYKVNLQNPVSSHTVASNTNSSVTIDSDYTEEATIIYKDGNPVQVIRRDGVNTSYIWGHNNTLPIAKAIGVDYNTLSAAYSAVGGNLSSLRSHASLAQALVSTYTYDPLIGMTSQTDPAGIVTYYEYDDFGRLKNVKDAEGNILQHTEYHYAK
jgi:YD repeat-containing protein